jgi:hypothetical protein
LTEDQLEQRRRKWSPPPHKVTGGALWKVPWSASTLNTIPDGAVLIFSEHLPFPSHCCST